MFHHSGEPDHPGCKLDIDERQMRAEEIWTVLITDFDDLLDLVLQLLCTFHLLVEFLSLEELIESWDYLSVDLSSVSFPLEECTQVLT